MKTEMIKSAGRGELFCRFWEPEGAPAAAVQLVHGIAEHGGRYDAFARFLAGKGLLVASEDHMGHGGSVPEGAQPGCISGGWDAMVEDVHRLTERLRARCPDLPFFLLGHSMGSFLARTYLYTYPREGLKGAILSGTAWQPGPVLAAGRMLCAGEVKKQGADSPSPRLRQLMFGSYTKGIPEVRTPNDWICTDPAVADAYTADPLCGFIPSGGLIAAMLEGIARNQKKGNLDAMPKSLPVLFIAGDRDPVGNMGKGVRQSEAAFRQAGLGDVSLKLYPGARHEVLNETDKARVWADVLAWLEARLG